MCGLLITGNFLHAQLERKIFAGIGAGFDYGGIGGKIEYLPVDHVGVFGGLGYNLLSVGWNIGAAYKIRPDKKLCPNLMAFFGYNAVFKGSDSYSKQYEVTSYGLSLGASLDILVGSKGNKLSVGFFIPVRSSKFNDTYTRAKADPNMKVNSIMPFGASIGYNFRL